jgi:predicted RNase H-like HicB family nuclease
LIFFGERSEVSGGIQTRLYWIMKFRVVLDYDPETQSWSSICPELPGCASAGTTEEEARQGIREAIQLYLAPADLELPPNAKLVEVTIG